MCISCFTRFSLHLKIMKTTSGNKSQHTDKKSSKLFRFWKILGPGLVTGASDDDPSGIATYSQPVLYLMLLFSFPAIVMNIGADIAGMGAVGNLLFPSIKATYFSIGFTITILSLIIYLPYQKIASVLKYLCLVLLVYLIVPFLYKQDWVAVLKATIIPTIRFDKDFISILVAILGTTISPYLFFWQATMEVEDKKKMKKDLVVNKRLIKEMRKDVDFGMLFSNLVMFFIILTTGSVLFNGVFIRLTQ